MRRIAAPVSEGRVAVSLEKATHFKVYDIEEGRVVSSSELDGGLGALVCSEGLEAVLCGMLAPSTRRELAMAGVSVFAGVYGEADEVVHGLLDNTLECVPDTMRGFNAAHYSPCEHSGEH